MSEHGSCYKKPDLLGTERDEPSGDAEGARKQTVAFERACPLAVSELEAIHL